MNPLSRRLPTRPPIDRVSPRDFSNLRVEDHGLPMHVAALALLDGTGLRGPDGRVALDVLRAHVRSRLHLAPVLRRILLSPPLGFGLPAWVDDPGFDIREHVLTRSLPPPGDEAALLAACTQINERPLDRHLPLWQIWLLTGLADGRVGMLIRLHHVIADGLGTVALLGSLFDLTPAPPPVAEPGWRPAPPPPRRDLLVDNARRRWAGIRRLGTSLARPGRWTARIGGGVTKARGLLSEGLAPRSSLNAPVGRRRTVALVRSDLERVRAVAHAHGGKVNDVMLAAVAGGARALLGARGELTPGLVLRASVPVSVRRPEDPAAAGNLTGVMIVPLPVGEPDPARRLDLIVRATAERKRRAGSAMGWDVGSPLLQRLMVGVMDRQRLVNLLLSNVPGPPVRMHFAGSEVRELFQLGVVQGNVTVAVGALSYAGQLNFDVVGDAEACPDLAVFATGLRQSLQELGAGRRTIP